MLAGLTDGAAVGGDDSGGVGGGQGGVVERPQEVFSAQVWGGQAGG